MNKESILEKMTEVFRDVFGNDELGICESTNAEDIEEWDSLYNITLISELEDTFSVEFTLEQIASFKNVGEIADAIISYLEQRGDN
jgi:acyl carrier protein